MNSVVGSLGYFFFSLHVSSLLHVFFIRTRSFIRPKNAIIVLIRNFYYHYVLLANPGRLLFD